MNRKRSIVYILITHEHFDHCSPDDVSKIQQDGTVIVTDKGSAAKLSGDVRAVAPGGAIDGGRGKNRGGPGLQR